MSLLESFFENGTLSGEMLASDPGSPSPFDQVASSSATAFYDNTHCKGNLAARFETHATGDEVAWAGWLSRFGAQTSWSMRFYLWLGGTPPSGSKSSIACWTNNTGVTKGRVTLQEDKKLRLCSTTGVVLATAPEALPENAQVRLEWHVTHKGAEGTQALRVYVTHPEGAVGEYDYELTVTGQNNGEAAEGVKVGWSISGKGLPPLWIDTLAAGEASTFLGPAASEEPREVVPFTFPIAPALGQVTVPSIAQGRYIGTEHPERMQWVNASSPYGTGLLLRNECREFDIGSPGDEGPHDRVQISGNGISYPPGQAYWLATARLLEESTFPIGSLGWWLCLQMFGSSGGTSSGSPPFALEIDKKEWTAAIRGGVKASPGETAPHTTFAHFAPVTFGVFHEFLIYVNQQTSEAGEVHVYHRLHGEAWPSEPQVAHTGVNVLTVAGQPQWVYPEWGQYRERIAPTTVTFDPGMLIRPTRAEAELLFSASPINPLIAGYGVGRGAVL